MKAGFSVPELLAKILGLITPVEQLGYADDHKPGKQYSE